MKNIYIYCEGPTEESFINEIMFPYFFSIGAVVYPIVCTTKRTPAKKYKGGVSDYLKIKKELKKLCKSYKHENITTMFDYYAMPDSTPNISYIDPDICKRMEIIEASINEDIGEPNCTFHFMAHEFEGILFSDPTAFNLIADEETVAKIQRIRSDFPTPEHINNSPTTAPSKRLEALIHNYAKVKNGTLLSKHIGIYQLMNQCPHFCKSIETLTSMV